MIRSALLALSFGFSALLLGGCWDRNEVNDLALVTGSAIDQKDNNTIELTLQIFIPRGGGGGMGMGEKDAGGSATTYVQSATGENIADALSRLQEKVSRKIFWGHSEVVIFSEEAAKAGIEGHVDYLMRAPQPRERAYVYVSKGKARRVLELHSILERNTSEVLREMSKSKLAMNVTLTELAYMLKGESRTAALPYLKELPPIAGLDPNKTNGYVNGTAIFKKDKMIGLIDEHTSRGLLWLRNEMKTAVITVHPESSPGTVSLRLARSMTKLTPRIENGKWSMHVFVDTEDDAVQNTTKLNLLSDPEAIKEVERHMNENIEQSIKLALKRVQTDMGADVLHFAETFHRAYPKLWKQLNDNWDEQFPNVEVTVQVHAKMLRPGLSNVNATKKGRGD